jgi:transcriptional regulator with XRE-family HTH domain
METSNHAASDIEHRIAARLKHLRASRGLSLDALAKRSGVSRSMISLIERAESNATASVLDKLAASLGVTLAAFFAEEGREDSAPVARAADQRSWRDPATGYVRRNLSPSFPSPIELVEVFLPAGTRVAYESGARSTIVNQQIWVIAGAIEVTVGEDVHRLSTGDCLAMRLDRPTAFRNEGAETAHYLVALTTDLAVASPKNP